jgi:hypothetical protein
VRLPRAQVRAIKIAAAERDQTISEFMLARFHAYKTTSILPRTARHRPSGTYAVVLSVDEKSQIQALDRTQPGLPMKKGRCGTMTHDCKRHGTTTLFAALNVLEGKVIGRCMQRHRHQEIIRFLNTIEADIPADKIIRVVFDNYATHKHAGVRAWLQRHPRFGEWLRSLLARAHRNTAIVALANELARIAWAVLQHRARFQAIMAG